MLWDPRRGFALLAISDRSIATAPRHSEQPARGVQEQPVYAMRGAAQRRTVAVLSAEPPPHAETVQAAPLVAVPRQIGVILGHG
jgi:predicted pyridoxine 5'-phosphate oxidase superfamily flavin-nucleotide-binding protein